MKIIATVNPDQERYRRRFLVEIEAKELAQICGAVNPDRALDQFKPGDEIEVAEAYTKLTELNRFSVHLVEARVRLRQLADALEPIDAHVRLVTEGKQEEEDGAGG